MKTRISYRWNDIEEIETITTEDGYNFGDYLRDNNLHWERDTDDDEIGTTYYILDEFGDRTDEEYIITNIVNE